MKFLSLEGLTEYTEILLNKITTKLNEKADNNHVHNYAGSSSAGGAATSALTCTGNSNTATTLQTARTIQTNLGSTATASFNGSANITPGITGTLPISYGGTGSTTAAGALTNLGLTATATELNYCDGVTSNIQTQLNSKATSSHTHNYMENNPSFIEMNANGSLKGYGGFIDFHYISSSGVASSNTDYSSRIIESNDGVIEINGATFKRSDQSVSAKTFVGSLSGSADTVDGFHASASVGYYLRPISYGTSALTAGSSSLTSGYVYLQYE